MTGRRLEWVTALLAALLGALYLLAPRMGTDLAAQMARAAFFTAHGYTPIDLRWYAGVNQLGYSLISPPVMSALGVRVTGALSLLATAVLFALLLRRTSARRPYLAAVLGAICIAGNLVSGRVTYALGVAFAVAALTALTFPRLRWPAALAALLAGATSPVAGLFVGLAGAALLLSAARRSSGAALAAPGSSPSDAALSPPDSGPPDSRSTDTVESASEAAARSPREAPASTGNRLTAAGGGQRPEIVIPGGFTGPTQNKGGGWPGPTRIPAKDQKPSEDQELRAYVRDDHPTSADGQLPARNDHPTSTDARLPARDDHAASGDAHPPARDDHTTPDDAHPPARDDHTTPDDAHLPARDGHPISVGARSPARYEHPNSADGHVQGRDGQLTRWGARERVRKGLLIGVPAAVPLIANAGLFGDGGWMNISHNDTWHAVFASLVVAVLVPVRPVRIGAVLSAVGVLAAALVHTPVGLNATRLVVMFALPVLAGYATLPGRRNTTTRDPAATDQELSTTGQRLSAPRGLSDRKPAGHALRRLVPVLVVTAIVEPPVQVSDVLDIGNPTADAAYFAPLVDQLRRQPLIGRVEIPPTRDYWEAASMGDLPLARGWLRQADIDRNPLFFTTIPGMRGTGVPLTADTYRDWLAEQAVQFVAVPDATLTWSGKPEAALVRAGVPGLTEVWSDAHWHLYRVADPRPIVTSPATLTGSTADALTVDAPQAGDVPLRVRYYRYLTATGGATVRRAGDWTILHVPGPGTYTLTS